MSSLVADIAWRTVGMISRGESYQSHNRHQRRTCHGITLRRVCGDCGAWWALMALVAPKQGFPFVGTFCCSDRLAGRSSAIPATRLMTQGKVSRSTGRERAIYNARPEATVSRSVILSRGSDRSRRPTWCNSKRDVARVSSS